MIKDFTPRLYQQTILGTCTQKNTLVVLPTGLGKTYVFMMLAVQRLDKFPDSKILFLGPTRPLINQYYELFKKHVEIDEEKMAVFTGYVRPDKREELWNKARIVFSTPQGMENDIINKRVDLSNVSLLGFDEAHRAVGDYAYVWIAKQYMKKAKSPRVLALTASPGSDLEKITEVCTNLSIEDVEIRTDEDPDVKPYIQDVKIKWVYVELPDYFKRIQKHLKDCLNSKSDAIKEMTEINRSLESKRDLLATQRELLKRMAHDKSYETMKSLSLVAEAMKVQHALELLESQGVTPLLEYMEGLVSKASTTKVKAVKNLVRDLNFKSALVLTRNLKDSGLEHPKYPELKDLVRKYMPDKKIIIFSQYRDSISSLHAMLQKIKGVRSAIFVGQQKKKGTGLSQKQQLRRIKEFREGKYNVLVMSSVGEEGLDIPAVDGVIFYEPVPSAIRTIQRRGRTGRQSKGEVTVLVTKGTRDEGYRWSAHHKEKRMYKVLDKLKEQFSPTKRETTLSEFIQPQETIKIHADYREKGSGVVKKLVDLGVDVTLEQLNIGDYLLSPHLVVEYKTVPDFVDSLIDKRLFSQLKEMKKYPRQLIILEGTEDIYAQRKMHPNAIRGMLATIAIDYNVSILRTKHAKDTALLMAVIAKREQTKEVKSFTMHSTKPNTLKEQQEYIVSALPGVGPLLSKPLLEKFKSIKHLVNASEDELRKVDLIGEKKAARIKDVLEKDYS